MTTPEQQWAELARRWRHVFSFYTSTDEVTRALDDLAWAVEEVGLEPGDLAGAAVRLSAELVAEQHRHPRPTSRDQEQQRAGGER